MAGRYIENHSLCKRNTFEPILMLTVEQEKKKKAPLSDTSGAKWNDALCKTRRELGSKGLNWLNNVCISCFHRICDKT